MEFNQETAIFAPNFQYTNCSRFMDGYSKGVTDSFYMEVENPETEVAWLEIPELIGHIFSFIPFEKKNWLYCLLTCKKWFFVGKLVFDPSVRKNFAIRLFSFYGDMRRVRELMQDTRINPSDYNNHSIRMASFLGHASVVVELLKDGRVDPAAHDNYALKWACINGHVEVVTELLRDGRVDPRTNENEAFCLASRYGHKRVLEVLLKDSRVDQRVVFPLLLTTTKLNLEAM